MLKNDPIGTLINPHFQAVHYELINRIIGFFRHLNLFGYTRCDITESVLVYTSVCDLFRKLCLPFHSMHHSLPPHRKCNNRGHPYKLPDLWLLNCPDLNPVD